MLASESNSITTTTNTQQTWQVRKQLFKKILDNRFRLQLNYCPRLVIIKCAILDLIFANLNLFWHLPLIMMRAPKDQYLKLMFNTLLMAFISSVIMIVNLSTLEMELSHLVNPFLHKNLESTLLDIKEIQR